MSPSTPRERLHAALRGEANGRPPVICPGGMMTPLCAEIVATAGIQLPACHREAGEMARAALAIHEMSGFENLGVPFCMTVEAEAFGLPVDYGHERRTPHVEGVVPGELAAVGALRAPTPRSDARAAAVLEAIERLKNARPDVPVIGNVVGPVSLACMVVELHTFVRGLKRSVEGQAVHGLLDVLTDWLTEFAAEQVRRGADVIAIAEPTGTGEILGPRWFDGLCLPYLNRILDAVHSAGALSLVHICGRTRSIASGLNQLRTPCISIDSVACMRELRAQLPGKVVMGNVSPFVIERGPRDPIERACARSIQSGARILAPACGITPDTPIAHLRAVAEFGGASSQE